MMPQRASAASSIALSIPESFPTKLRTATATVRGGAAGQTSEGPERGEGVVTRQCAEKYNLGLGALPGVTTPSRRELYSLRRGQRSGDRRAPGGRQWRYLAPVRPRRSRNGQQKRDEQQQQEPQTARHAGFSRLQSVLGRHGRYCTIV